MARLHSVPDILVPEMMIQLRQGSNMQEVSDWLRDNHNIIASVRVCTYRLRELRKLDNEYKISAIQAAAQKSALDCVGIIDDQISVLNVEALKLLQKKDTQSKLAGKQIADTLIKFIDKKMNLSGMDKDDGMSIETEDLLNGLLKKLGE
jgi:hypothetical protein